MKKIFILIILSLFCGCKKNEEGVKLKSKEDKIVLMMGDTLLFSNHNLLDVIKDYNSCFYKDSEYLPIIVLKQEKINDISYLISHITSQKQLLTFFPSGYFIFNKRPVLLYSGLEKISKNSKEYRNRLYTLSKKFLYNDVDNNSVVVSHPPVWRVDICGDSISVYKNLPSDSFIKFDIKKKLSLPPKLN